MIEIDSKMRRNYTKDVSQWIYEFNLFKSKINSLKNTCIVVEGKGDSEALRSIGVSLPILIYNSPHFSTIIAEMPYKEVIILTDWDNKGKQIYERLRMLTQSIGKIVNEYFRMEFRRLTIYMGEQVEDICKKINRLLFIFDKDRI